MLIRKKQQLILEEERKSLNDFKVLSFFHLSPLLWTLNKTEDLYFSLENKTLNFFFIFFLSKSKYKDILQDHTTSELNKKKEKEKEKSTKFF